MVSTNPHTKMTRMRQTQRDGEFIDQLLQLFRQEGFRHLTIGDMAARLHCSRRRLYEVAESKDAIIRTATQHDFDRQLAQGDQVARDEQDPALAIAAYLRVGVLGSRGVSLRWVADINAGEDTRALFDAYQRARSMRLVELVNEGVRQGVFAPCHGQVIAEAMLHASMRLRRPDFLTQAGVTIEEAFDEFYRVVLGGLLLKK
jgi:AcrR family transcriptional regulator